MISRRGALKIAGGGALAIGGVGLARAWDQGLIFASESPGLAAWDDWNQQRFSGPLALVSAGVLASSPHNTQPWRFAIGRHGVDIFEVPQRALGPMDPFGRERLAGLGAAVHNMALATTEIGRPAVVRLLPDARDPRHVARIELGAEVGPLPARHPLVGAIGRRHTDRGPWRGGPILASELQTLAATAGTPLVRIQIIDPGSPTGKRFAALTLEATAAIAEDKAMMEASHHWFRHSRREQDRLKDGLSLRTSGVPDWLANVGAMLPEQSAESEGRYWLEGTRDTALPTASAFALITVRDPWDRRSAILAGSAWQRFHLTAISLGLAAQPLNQLPEMIDRERQLGRPPGFARRADAMLEDPAWRPTFALRLGHPFGPARASVRRPVSEVMGPPARLAFDVERSKADTAKHERALETRRGTP